MQTEWDMTGKTILQYEILEQLGEVPTLSAMRKRAVTMLSIPPKGGSQRSSSV